MNKDFGLSVDNSGKVVLSDERLQQIEKHFVRSSAGAGTNDTICGGINDSCTNSGDCRGGTNNTICANNGTCGSKTKPRDQQF